MRGGGGGRSAGGGEPRRGVGQVEVAEDGANGLGVGEEGEDAHVRAALGAAEGEDLVDAGEELGPAGAGAGAGEGCGGLLVGLYGGLLAGSSRGAFFGIGRAGVVAAEDDDRGPEPCVGGEDAVVSVAVDPGRGDQTGERFEKLEG